ncbi:hypothetical protein K439DRAFT_1624685 [Ramaria rubella]|nr:hypothetical protein K439DRAFT_1624685 [Ramaria rubella]
MLPLFADPKKAQPGPGKTILEIMKEVYENPILTPVSFERNAPVVPVMVRTMKNEQVDPEINRLACEWEFPKSLTQEQFDSKVEELMHLGILLMFGTSKPGRKPMVQKTEYRARILRHLFAFAIALCVYRGRPEIGCNVLMSYPLFPQAPSRGQIPHSIVSPEVKGNTFVNPWPMIIQSILLAPDSHTLKTLRTIIYGDRCFGVQPAGYLIGAVDPKTGEETHPGTKLVDGTVWVRCAGVLADSMGWIAEGEKAALDWDRTGLGWEEAWDEEPIVSAKGEE